MGLGASLDTFQLNLNIVIPPWQALAIAPVAQLSGLQQDAISSGDAIVFDGTDKRFQFDDSLLRDDGRFVKLPEQPYGRETYRRIRRAFRRMREELRDGSAEGGIGMSDDAHLLAQVLPPCGIPIGGSYITKRTLGHSGVFTQIAMGRPLHVWMIDEMKKAADAKQDKFRIAVLGHGDGNTERELAHEIVNAKRRLDLQIDVEMTGLTLPNDNMTLENKAAIGALSASGIVFHEECVDYEKNMPLENIDVLYGVCSTSYARDPLDMTVKIHDVLRKPSADRAGGQAFFMYWNSAADPAFDLERHFFDLRRLGFDIVASVPTSDDFDELAFVHMRRISTKPAKRLKKALAAVELNPSIEEFRTLADSESVKGYKNASDIFTLGARLLFSGNGISQSALPNDLHRQTFARIWPAVSSGMPIYPDAVCVAYGLSLDAIRNDGVNFRKNLPREFLFNPAFLIPPNWSKRFRQRI